jgi:RNA chaperone Hfq
VIQLSFFCARQDAQWKSCIGRLDFSRINLSNKARTKSRPQKPRSFDFKCPAVTAAEKAGDEALFIFMFTVKLLSLMGVNKMASEKSRNLQEIFLNNVRKSHAAVTVFLINGVKLQGIITWFDNFSILLKRDQHVQLVYKHAISTIMPVAPVQLQDFDEKDMDIEGE